MFDAFLGAMGLSAFNECVSICCQIIKLMLMPCVNGGTLKQFYCIKTSIGVPQTCFLLLIFQELTFLKSSCFCWISFLVLRRQTRVCRWCIRSFSVYRGGRHLQWLWFRNGSAHRCIQLVSVSRQMPSGAGSKPCFQSEFHCSHTHKDVWAEKLSIIEIIPKQTFNLYLEFSL